MDQVEASLNSIESTSRSVLEILDSTPTDLAIICPLVSPESFETDLGVDLTYIVQSVAEEYDRLQGEVSAQLAVGNNLVDKITNGVSDFETSVAVTEEYMWAIPALLFAIGVLSATSMLGVVMAWKEKSGVQFQRTMSWIVLPLLILASIATWMVVVFASMGSMVGTGKYTASNYCKYHQHSHIAVSPSLHSPPVFQTFACLVHEQGRQIRPSKKFCPSTTWQPTTQSFKLFRLTQINAKGQTRSIKLIRWSKKCKHISTAFGDKCPRLIP
jgi:hypothetical protein